MKTENEKLGQAPAFATVGYGLNGDSYLQEGMSKRFYAANKSLSTANSIINEWSVKTASDFIGINSDEYKPDLHYHVAVVKMAYILAEELLKQENL